MESAKDVGKNVEVNEYQEALDKVLEIATYGEVMNEKYNSIFHSNVKKIQELVDKATPKKPNNITIPKRFGSKYIACPTCGKGLTSGRCCSNNECRQAIDWSKDER